MKKFILFIMVFLFYFKFASAIEKINPIEFNNENELRVGQVKVLQQFFNGNELKELRPYLSENYFKDLRLKQLRLDVADFWQQVFRIEHDQAKITWKKSNEFIMGLLLDQFNSINKGQEEISEEIQGGSNPNE
jgi:hypothetical protein